MMKLIFKILLTLLLLIGCAGPKKQIETVFYPMPPQTPKLQFLTSITGEDDIGKEKSAFREFLLGETKSVKQIARPYGIAAGKGKIYVSDRTYKKILIIDLVKKEFDYIKAEREASISEPGGIWVEENGYKYVADFERKQILVFDAEDEYVRAYGDEGQFGKPVDVVVYGGRVYVCDFDKHQVIILDKESGETIGSIGGEGNEEGKLYKPTHLYVDKLGNLYVNDSFNFRIQKFDPQGQFEKVYGYQGDTLGGFARPKGISVDDDGYIYVVDTAFENVQIFDNESTYLLLFFGGFGPAPGSMYLPNSIYIDYENIEYFKKFIDKDFKVKYLVYVGNMLGKNKLNVYGFGEWIGPQLPGVKPTKIKFE